MPVDAKFGCSGYAAMACPNESMYTVTAYGSQHPNTHHVFSIVTAAGWYNTPHGLWRCPECVERERAHRNVLASALRATASHVQNGSSTSYDDALAYLRTQYDKAMRESR